MGSSRINQITSLAARLKSGRHLLLLLTVLRLANALSGQDGFLKRRPDRQKEIQQALFTVTLSEVPGLNLWQILSCHSWYVVISLSNKLLKGGHYIQIKTSKTLFELIKSKIFLLTILTRDLNILLVKIVIEFTVCLRPVCISGDWRIHAQPATAICNIRSNPADSWVVTSALPLAATLVLETHAQEM